MHSPDPYIAFAVGLMFLGGVVLIVQLLRQRSRDRRQWSGASPRRAHSKTQAK